MNVIKSLEKILKYNFYNDNLVLLNSSFDLSIEDKTIIKNVKNFAIFNNSLYVELKDQLVIYNEYFSQQHLFGKYFLSNSQSIENGIIILKEDINDDEYYIIKNNFETSQVSWHNSFVKYFSKNNFISIFKSSLSYHNIINGDVLWEKVYSENIKSLEIWNEEIVLLELTGKSTNQINALNARSGSLIWEKDGGGMILKSDKLYFLEYSSTSQILKQYNLKENTEQQYDLTKIIIDQFNKIPYFLYEIKDNHMYISFTNEKTIVMIDLKTMLTEWVYKIETSAWQIDKPQIQGGNLYVLDSDKVLHIFEKE